ncbi:MAG: hypothetical protein GY716_14470 [bacterium]|nr:hypothetical protein [bacterium]
MLYLPGCNRSERKAEALYREARQHVREQQLDDALALYAKIVDEHPRTDAARRAAEELDVYRNLRRAVTEYPGHKARDLLVETARAIEVFRVRRGAWPRSLDKLKPGLLSQSPIDPWGRVLRYETKKGKNGYRLACLGSDGKVGGTGDASDWLIEDGVLVRHP